MDGLLVAPARLFEKARLTRPAPKDDAQEISPLRIA